MPRPSQYSRSRRIVMQAVMWTLLLATFGLAALVDRVKAPPVQLGAAVQYQQVRVQTPDGWKVSTDTKGWLPRRFIVTARERPAGGWGGPAGREVRVTQQRVTAGATPEAGLAALAEDVLAIGPVEPCRVGPYPGATVAMRTARVTNGEAEAAYRFAACAVTPEHFAITVELEGPGRSTIADQRLFQKILETVQWTPAEAP